MEHAKPPDQGDNSLLGRGTTCEKTGATGEITMSKERLKDSYDVYKERGGKHSRNDFYKFFWSLRMSIDEILTEEKER